MGEETLKERLDRELIELLNELRILLPGVQVLFAFLLTVPFNTGFSNATTFHGRCCWSLFWLRHSRSAGYCCLPSR